MNRRDTLLWGFLSTLVLTTLMALGQGMGLTRLSMPYLLGTVFSHDPDRARVIGFVVHLINGWIVAMIYALVFQSLGRATWWLGALLGLGQALFVLAAALPVLPAFHPRMASERHGPSPTRQLEPPGFLGLNYGYRTPVSILVAHLAYGALLGAGYRLR